MKGAMIVEQMVKEVGSLPMGSWLRIALDGSESGMFWSLSLLLLKTLVVFFMSVPSLGDAFTAGTVAQIKKSSIKNFLALKSIFSAMCCCINN